MKKIQKKLKKAYKKIIIFFNRKPFQPKQLLSQITKNNLHKEDNYKKVGKEFW